MVNEGVKVAIYARVSTQEQAVEGTSLEYQSDQLTKYCEAQGWGVVQQYVDPGHTGKDGDRPGLKRLLVDAKLGMFSKVIVFKLDRLARKLRLMLELEEKLKDCGIGILSVKETIDTSTSIGRTVFQVLGLVAEWEREAIVERTTAGRLQRYREGCWGPGRVPYGFTYSRDTKKLEIDESQARIVRLIYDEYSKGKSMTALANMLNEMHIPPRGKNGKGWRNGSVRDILFNPAYKGTLVVNIHKEGNRGKKCFSNLPDDAIVISVPPIVDDSIWNIAQERRKNNKHLRPPRNGHWLLQGLITCGLCGYGFRTEVTHTRRRYGCRGRLKYTHIDGSPRCTSPRIDADWLESEVWNRIEAIVNDPNRLEELLGQTVEDLRNREADLVARIRPIDDELAHIAEQKAKLAGDWVQTNMNHDKFKELRDKLEREESRLKTIRNEHDPAQIEELEHTRRMLNYWQRQLQALDWDTETEDGQKVRVMDKPHQAVLRIVGSENEELSDIVHFPATKRKLLDMLQVRVVAFVDRVEIKAVFPIQPIECQLLQPTYRLNRYPQSR